MHYLYLSLGKFSIFIGFFFLLTFYFLCSCSSLHLCHGFLSPFVCDPDWIFSHAYTTHWEPLLFPSLFLFLFICVCAGMKARTLCVRTHTLSLRSFPSSKLSLWRHISLVFNSLKQRLLTNGLENTSQSCHDINSVHSPYRAVTQSGRQWQRIWRNCDPRALLVGMHSGVATEAEKVTPQKTPKRKQTDYKMTRQCCNSK